ncbi:MAG TPA: haloacid dehalogenase type II [Burkholderiaceae bacterium]|nr:haloacid dehalogenase type II [Burkholderiaceae bacterium]
MKPELSAAPAGTLRALVFDVFGTLVDWRAGVARELRRHLRLEPVEAEALADAWRAEYQPSMEAVRAGRIAFCKLDRLHRRNLDIVLERFGHDPDEAVRCELTLAWHRLDAWPDVTPALARLRERYWLAPCSNGHFALMAALARRNGWHWDALAGAELARDYKPKAVVYQAAAAAFDCAPHEVMMVAAHSDDLAAAAAAGLRTGFVARPHEHGPGRGERAPAVPVDASASDLQALADRLLGDGPGG